MSAAENKVLIHRFVEEVWNQGHMAVVDEIFGPDFVDHNPASPELAPGPAGAKQVFSMFRAAFPDLQLTIEDLVAEGDKLVWRWTSRGTHQGALMDIPPTNKTVTVTGMELYRLAGGKVRERWGNFDQLGLLVQLGVVPPPGG